VTAVLLICVHPLVLPGLHDTRCTNFHDILCLGSFAEICQQFAFLIRIKQKQATVYMKPHVGLCDWYVSWRC